MQRTVARNTFRPQTWRFGWNAKDQMVRATCPDWAVWTYAYDPFGRRVSKACPHHTKVTFLWDGDVIAREITEARGGPQTVDWFFEPGSFRPMARLERGNLSYVINDHLGTPKEVVGADGYLLWSADHDTWVTLRTRKTAGSTQGEEDDFWLTLTDTPDSTTAYPPDPAALYCPIRFQGQWEDAETGLYYNRFRSYDPLAAVFVSLDPLGVKAGLRSSSYVHAPHLLIDPFGLTPCCAAKYRACRPRFRSGVVDKVWENAVAAAQAKGLDYILDPGNVRIPVDSWSPGQGRSGVWDMGHLPGHEYRETLRDLEQGLITPEEFRSIYNDPNNYRVEHPSTNRGHQYEGLPVCGLNGD